MLNNNNNHHSSSSRRRRPRQPLETLLSSSSTAEQRRKQQQQQQLQQHWLLPQDSARQFLEDGDGLEDIGLNDDDDGDDELKPLTPRDAEGDLWRSTANQSPAVDASMDDGLTTFSPLLPNQQQQQQRTSVSSSTVAAANNHWMKFDDQGQSSSYLQFFKSPSRFYTAASKTTTTSTSSWMGTSASSSHHKKYDDANEEENNDDDERGMEIDRPPTVLVQDGDIETGGEAVRRRRRAAATSVTSNDSELRPKVPVVGSAPAVEQQHDDADDELSRHQQGRLCFSPATTTTSNSRSSATSTPLTTVTTGSSSSSSSASSAVYQRRNMVIHTTANNNSNNCQPFPAASAPPYPSPSDISSNSSHSLSSMLLLSASNQSRRKSNTAATAAATPRSTLYDDENIPIAWHAQHPQPLSSSQRPLYFHGSSSSSDCSTPVSSTTGTGSSSSGSGTPWSCPYPNPHQPSSRRLSVLEHDATMVDDDEERTMGGSTTTSGGVPLFGESISWSHASSRDLPSTTGRRSPHSAHATTAPHGTWWNRRRTSERRQSSLRTTHTTTPVDSLAYWQDRHEHKMERIQPMRRYKNDTTTSDGSYYDFVLILQPQAVYSFWAEHLDFRTECLGPTMTQALEASWEQQDAAVAAAAEVAPPQHSPSVVSEASTMVSWATSVWRGGRGKGRKLSHEDETCETPLSTDVYQLSADMAAQVGEQPPVMASIFERAFLQSTGGDAGNTTTNSAAPDQPTATASAAENVSAAIPSSAPHTPFRRWGVQPVVPTTATAAKTNPIPTSATRMRPSAPLQPQAQQPAQQQQQHSSTSIDTNKHPNELTIDDIPDQVIARGIAARTNRTNGLLPFLGAVAPPRSVSLWLHRPGLEACRIRLSSPDGGDTLHTTALWRKTWHVSDIVAVHPARNPDATGLGGTVSLRKSKSSYHPERTFSVVLARQFPTKSTKGGDWQAQPHVPGQFRYIDLEADSEETYWLVFRGLLLLYRDAQVGRFAKQRAAGMGASTTTATSRYPLPVDVYHEPATAGFLERRMVEWNQMDDTYLQGFVTTDRPSPPPSDYFLGFKSPGTAIWSRLRQAGLETSRAYALDPARVMIKVRCPQERLHHVAEVLRLQMKTSDGESCFAPFREELMGVLFSPKDSFRSSVRQTIIDFIIGSRIRDSGAELGPNAADLGPLILARVPLHMHKQLNEVFDKWFYFWKEEHWIASQQQQSKRRGKYDKYPAVSTRDLGDDEVPPNVVTRFLLGCMSQPLDSIEEYFGEKVAFYFTWLQHTASHLVFLSVPGLILFVCMLANNNFLHPLRPLFAIVVMMWTFIVLLNWKKRANMMAYRWGTMNYKEQETTRPQFKGDYVQDEITGEWIIHYPKWKRWLKYSISFPLTIFFTAGTLILILWVHANRDLQLAQYLNTNAGEKFEYGDFALSAIGKRPVLDVKFTRQDFVKPQFWFIVVGMPSMLGLFLPLLNFVLMRLSIWLNDFENYRTESEYRTYLIIKVFSFRFVSYFATLYYYAFVSSIVSEEEQDMRTDMILNGVLRVGSGVLIYTTVAQWWQNALQTCFPLLIRRLRMNHRNQRLADELRAIELEEERIAHIARTENVEPSTVKEQRIRLVNKRLLLDQAQDDLWLELMNPQHDSFPEYIQAVVQFTFVSCFSVVLPITPVLVLINYLVSMRLDAYKLCKTRRRPLAEKTGGIGVWEHVLHIVAVISVLTNCWLIGFTTPQFLDLLDGENGIGDLGLFALVVGWEHIMLLIKYVMGTSMSPFPKSVRDAMKRQQYETDKQRNTLMLERRRLKSPTKMPHHGIGGGCCSEV